MTSPPPGLTPLDFANWSLPHPWAPQTRSRSEVAALFRCNTSQLSKAITGVEYKSGPHHYKPKKASKRQTEDSTPDPTRQKKPRTTDADQEGIVLPEDTLTSSSSDSSLPPSLF